MIYFYSMFFMSIFMPVCFIAYKQVKLSSIKSMNEARAHRLILERREIDLMKPSDKQILALKEWKVKVASYVKDFECNQQFTESREHLRVVVNNDKFS